MRHYLLKRRTWVFVMMMAPMSIASVAYGMQTEEHEAWDQVDRIVNRIIVPTFPHRDYSVSEFGALGDGLTDCHQAFVQAIDKCARDGGGRVLVPAYIKALPDYQEMTAKSEDRDTGFPDWSHPEYQRFFLEFYKKFAQRYDRDRRLAFLETGFGLWAEYHIYSGPEEPGKTFPSKKFQARFFQHLTEVFNETPWMISQDAQAANRTPFASQPALLKLKFWIFDDSFHLAWKPGYNLDGWKFFGRDRYRHSPAGGEILFPNRQHEKYVAEHWATEVRNFGITFMICEQWPRLTTTERIIDSSIKVFASANREKSGLLVEKTL